MTTPLRLLALTTLAVLALAGPASASFGVAQFDGTIAADAGGTPATQAASHPYAITTAIKLNLVDHPPDGPIADGAVKDVSVDLPVGLLGDPSATPVCPQPDLSIADIEGARCLDSAQVGVIRVQTGADPTTGFDVPVYNSVPPISVPGQFGFNVFGQATIRANAVVRSTDHGLTLDFRNIPQTLQVVGFTLTMWGVPADASHDPQRGGCLIGSVPGPCPSTAAAKPYLTLPTRCSGDPLTFHLRTRSWEHPDDVQTASFAPAGADGRPLTLGGCDRVPFAPTATVQPTSRAANAPTGLLVDVHVPQDANPAGLAQSHLRRAVVTLPSGVAVSAAAANGLSACAPAQIDLAGEGEPTCPDASKIGTVAIATPLLDAPLTGSVYLAASHDNPFNSLLAVYVSARGSGVTIKLAGRIDTDPDTGQVTATFDDAPQLPFSDFRLTFFGGAGAVLTLPPTCGTATTTATFTSWSGGPPVTTTDAFTVGAGVDGGACAPTLGALPFAPSLSAGTTDPAAGASTSFALTVARDDGQQELSRIAASLPAGLLAEIGSVPPCPEAAIAAAGGCPAASRIGTTTVAAGTGPRPFSLAGPVYLGGPYRGAPFSLAIVVRAIAGPLDLGTVVVRAALFVDPVTAAVRVDSDPLPTMLQGIPLRLRKVAVAIDRPGFMTNPTSCEPAQIRTQLGSLSGASAGPASRFQAAGCAALGYAPKLALTLGGRGQTTDGKPPSLAAHLAPRPGDANSRQVRVRLPLSLALDPDNADALCEPAEAAADRCPAASIVGDATARSILADPLTGPVYFVHGLRTDPKTRRQISTLPKLYIPLRADGVEIKLWASSDVVDEHLVTTFDAIPDARIGAFDLNIHGGRHGILVIPDADLCKETQVTVADFRGHNGKAAGDEITMGTPCRLGVVASSHTATALKVTVGGLGAGRVTVSGAGLTTTRRTIRAATTATLSVPLGRAVRGRWRPVTTSSAASRCPTSPPARSGRSRPPSR